jgi:hypothetical protein
MCKTGRILCYHHTRAQHCCSSGLLDSLCSINGTAKKEFQLLNVYFIRYKTSLFISGPARRVLLAAMTSCLTTHTQGTSTAKINAENIAIFKIPGNSPQGNYNYDYLPKQKLRGLSP